jgi:transcriptional regulator with XRE-family HTH domain
MESTIYGFPGQGAAMEKSTFSQEYRVFRKLLKATRKAAGLTQVDLSGRLKETQSALSKAERGERRLDLVQLKRFCTACNTSLTAFVAEFESLTGPAKRR